MASLRSGKVYRRSAPPTGFDFTSHMRRLAGDLVERLPELGHIDLSRMAISFCQARKNVRHGMYASLTPMRFGEGKLDTVRRGRRWGIQRLYNDAGVEMLYILNFYLPRFLDLGLREKLTTVVHELWHVSPRFNGDLRRYRGRCYAHGSSRRAFDKVADRLVRRWLAMEPPGELYEFLRYDFRELSLQHGRVYGVKVPAPKLYPMD
jgi:hypothetical protein